MLFQGLGVFHTLNVFWFQLLPIECQRTPMCSQKSRSSIPVLCSMVSNFTLIPIKEGARAGVGSLVSKMQAFVYKISGFHKELITKAFNCCTTLSLLKRLPYFQERSGAAWELESRKFGREVKGYNLRLVGTWWSRQYFQEVRNNWHVHCLQDSEFLYVARQLGLLLENLSPLTRACHVVALSDVFDTSSTTLVRIWKGKEIILWLTVHLPIATQRSQSWLASLHESVAVLPSQARPPSVIISCESHSPLLL